jgi:DNA-binding beta-propeller fold protein YncE
MNLSILRNVAMASVLLLSACSNKDENTAPELALPNANMVESGVLYLGHETGPVSLYSLNGFNQLGALSIGESPASQGGPSLGLSEDGQFLAVAMTKANALGIVDTATRKATLIRPLAGAPSLVQVHGVTAVVAHAPKQISLVHLPTGEITRTFEVAIEPQNMALASNGQHLVATHEDFDQLFVYSLETGEPVQQIDLSEYGVRPRGVKPSPNGKHLALALEYSNKILILNDEYRVVGEVLTGEVPYTVAYNQDGSELVVALVRGKVVQVFDTDTLMLKREIPVGEQCLNFVFTPDHARLIVACALANKLLVLNYATGELIHEVQENTTPRGLAVSSQ